MKKYINIYQWNRGENRYVYFCKCANVSFRGTKKQENCHFCKKPIIIEEIGRVRAFFRALLVYCEDKEKRFLNPSR